MNWTDYQELLGIGFEDKSKLQMCKNRTKNIVSDLSKYYMVFRNIGVRPH